MKKSTKTLLYLLGLLILIVIVVVLFSNSDKSPLVKTEEVSKRKISESVTASGKIQPETDVKITSQVSGQIIELAVKEGDVVAAGDLLLKINPDLYTAAQSRAIASLNSSKSGLANSKARLVQAVASNNSDLLAYNRSKSLFDQGVISNADWDNVQAKYEISQAEVTSARENIKAAEYSIMSARATVSEAKENLNRTTIIAPKAGTITALSKEVGESVLGNQMMAGEIIMKVSDLQTMEVDVEVNESDIVKVTLGDLSTIEVDSYSDRKFEGVVTEIGNTALNSMGNVSSMDAVTNFSVKIRIDEKSYSDLILNGASPFRPGMSATVEINTNTKENILTVPIKAVTTRTDTSTSKHYRHESKEDKENKEPMVVVFVVDDKNKTHIKAIKTGIQDMDYYEVLSGLEEGEKVITGPFKMVSKNLRNGQEIRVKKDRKKTEKD